MKILDIVIITYNRAQLCLDQVSRVSKSLDGHPLLRRLCNVYVLDNASSQDYSLVMQLCKAEHFEYLRYPVNVASVGNQCRAALTGSSRYSWVLSDDDIILPACIAHLLLSLQRCPIVDLILFNDSVCSFFRYGTINDLLRLARTNDPIAISANTLISSLIFIKRLFDPILFWRHELGWFPLSSSVITTSIRYNRLAMVLSFNKYIQSSLNTQQERAANIKTDADCADSMLDKQFQYSILQFLNFLYSCCQQPTLSDDEYIASVMKKFRADPLSIYRGMTPYEKTLIVDPYDHASPNYE